MKCTVRMYRIGRLGDSFLIKFEDGEKRSHVLIDCGAFNYGTGVKQRVNEIADDIAAEIEGHKLDVIVGTHQHQDHLSGFVQAESKFAAMPKDEVWLCWLDDPSDSLARAIRKDKLKLQNNLLGAFDTLSSSRSSFASKEQKDILSKVENVLKFEMGFNADSAPKTPEKAIENLKLWGKDKTKYLSPGTSFWLPGLPEGKVKVHVLGPPRNKASLRDMNPGEGDSYDKHLTENALLAEKMMAAINRQVKPNGNGFYAEADNFPFPPGTFVMKKKEVRKHSVGQVYYDPRDSWRTIDDEWVGELEYLALYLDSYTNNSSLVLAFELIGYNKVLLFTADAQMGNWKSWEKIKWDDPSLTTDDLLGKTVLYKVGHHCSHNATYVEAFEKMTHPELVAMIPVDEANAKAQGWKMPATKLFKAISKKTNDRVIRMDKPPSDTRKFRGLPPGRKIAVTDLYIDYTLGGL